MYRDTVNSNYMDIIERFDNVMRNDNETMHSHLKSYKDYAVVIGKIIGAGNLNYPSDRGRTYSEFMCGWSPRGIAGWGGEDPTDGDINFEIRIERDKLDNQPGFWTDDWLNDSNNIRNKLDSRIGTPLGFSISNNQIHPEIIMYGRPAGVDRCDGNVNTSWNGFHHFINHMCDMVNRN